MSLETKLLLVAINEIVQLSETKEEIFESLQRIAGAEGITLEKLEPRKKGDS